MRRDHDSYADPEDLFADTRMSFGDHIEDLRVHLIRAGLGFLIGMIFALFFLGKPVLEMIAAPVKRELFKFQLRNLDNRKAELDEALTAAKGLRAIALPIKLHVPALREALGMPSKDATLFKPLLAGVEDLLRELQVDHLVDKDLLQHNQWVEVPAQIGDPDTLIRALQRLKPFIDPPTLRTFTVMETFVVYFKVALLTGLVLTSPWVFYQIWAFIAAGLYPHEKRLVHYYLPFSLGLFLGGVIMCQVYVIPKAIEALLWFNEWLGFEPELRLSDWLGFAIMMPLLFGICFQTPLVMTFVNKVGIVDVQVFRNQRRIAWFLMAIFAAIITPTVDAISMLFLWVPMGILYEIGILLCDWQQRNRPPEDLDVPSGEELVEV